MHVVFMDKFCQGGCFGWGNRRLIHKQNLLCQCLCCVVACACAHPYCCGRRVFLTDTENGDQLLARSSLVPVTPMGKTAKRKAAPKSAPEAKAAKKPRPLHVGICSCALCGKTSEETTWDPVCVCSVGSDTSQISQIPSEEKKKNLRYAPVASKPKKKGSCSL